MSILQKITTSALLSTILMPVAAFAQTYTFIETIPGLPTGASRPGLFGNYLSTLFQIALTTAAILAMLFIIVGGVRYTLTAVSPSDKGAAKKLIWNAIGGLLIVLAGWLVLWTINPDLVNFSLEVPSLADGGP